MPINSQLSVAATPPKALRYKRARPDDRSDGRGNNDAKKTTVGTIKKMPKPLLIIRTKIKLPEYDKEYGT